MNFDLEKLQKQASLAASKAKTATGNAVASAQKYHAEHPDAAANALSGAKNFLGDCAKKAFLTAGLRDFLKDPSIDKLVETPELLFQALQSLAMAKHPSAAIMTTMVQEGMQRAKGGEAAAAMQKKVMEQATNSAVSTATGGMVTNLPPEVSDAATNYLRRNPQVSGVSICICKSASSGSRAHSESQPMN